MPPRYASATWGMIMPFNDTEDKESHVWERDLSFIKIITVIMTEYFLSVYYKAHTMLNLIFYEYYLIFYPEKQDRHQCYQDFAE